MTCENCGGPLADTHATLSRTRPVRRFCDACAGYAEALAIGNPSVRAAFLYDNGRQRAVTWTGAEMGTIIHRNTPDRHRFGAVRYRVKMLDGSLWYGSGPTSNGNYIRLHRMAKGGT